MQPLLTTSSIKQLHHATTFNHYFFYQTFKLVPNNSIMQQLLTISSIKQLHHATTFNH